MHNADCHIYYYFASVIYISGFQDAYLRLGHAIKVKCHQGWIMSVLGSHDPKDWL